MRRDSNDPKPAGGFADASGSESYFDQAAATWDDNPSRVELAASVAKAMGQDVPLRADMQIMDFGCGTGLITYHLAPQVASVTAADVSAEMLAALRRKAEASGMTHVQPLLLEAEDAAPAAVSCDAIVSSMVFHHVADIPQLLQRFGTWIRPDGWVAVADLEPEDGTFHSSHTHVVHHGIEPFGLASQMENAGFAVKSVRTVHTLRRQPEGATDVREYPVFLLAAQKM